MGERGGRGDLIQVVRGNESPSGHYKTWPTPKAMDSRSAGPGTKDETLTRRAESQFGVNLAEAVQMDVRKLWPTPTRSDGMGGPGHSGRVGGVNLRTTVTFPTPCARDWKDGAFPAEYERNTPTLATHAGGQLNPQFVEWLMGFPLNWTEVK